MQAVIIADNSFASRERAMLARLEVGLADEGVRVVHAIPSALLSKSGTEAIGIQSTVVGYAETGLPFSVRRRTAELFRAIQFASEDPTPINIIHALGAGSWPIALELARQSHASVLLELWRPGLISAAAALVLASRSVHVITPEFIVSEPSIAEAIRKRAPKAKVYSAAWGVHAPSHPREPSPGDRPLAVALLSDTGDPRAFAPALAGLAEVAAGGQDLLIFAGIDETNSPRDAALWASARKLGLTDRLSIAPDMESRREPILQMDLLLLPEATGRQRTLTLEAMAAGVTVIAAPDPFLESLIEGTTARLIRSPTSGAWADAIRSITANRAAASQLIHSAHEHVRANRSASTHVTSILHAYQQASQPTVLA